MDDEAPTLTHETTGELLLRNARERPDADAAVFVEPAVRFTWRELREQTDLVARGLMALGLKRSEHVAVWGTNRPQWLLTQLAAAKIGAPLVTINPEWKQAELAYALHQSDTKVLVMFDGFTKVSGSKEYRYDYVKILREAKQEPLPQLEHTVLVSNQPQQGFTPWDDMLAGAEQVPQDALDKQAAEVTADDIVLIQYTSGTTGYPKGTMLTHFNVLNNSRIAAYNMRMTADDRLCGPVPFYHCFGSIMVNLLGLVTGAAIVLPYEHFDAHKTLAAIDAEKCTILHGVPTMFIGELEDPDLDKHDLTSLRTGIMAGAPCPAELMQAVMERMHDKGITIAYGLTEASPLTHQTRPDDPLDKRTLTVGKPIPHTEAKVVNPATHETLPDGEVGEIWVKGFHVMKGYYNNPEKTDEVILDGWLRSGDLGYIDPDGYYRIVGRLKEMFIVGGHNVYPAEVEQTLQSMYPKDIEMVQVVGVPHPKLQEVCAAVIKKAHGSGLTEEQVIEHCKESMEWPKVPRYIEFKEDFSDVSTVTGKIQKFKLREHLIKKLNLNTT
jgi:fatty-acyl-CoA synthase